jgi:hypothetical protein
LVSSLSPRSRRRCATCAGDRGLDALQVPPVAQLDERLPVEADPRHAALLGRVHQRRRARAQRAALGVADEGVAPRGPVERDGPAGRAGSRSSLGSSGRASACSRSRGELGRRGAHVALLVLEHHVVHARRPSPSGSCRTTRARRPRSAARWPRARGCAPSTSPRPP